MKTILKKEDDFKRTGDILAGVFPVKVSEPTTMSPS